MQVQVSTPQLIDVLVRSVPERLEFRPGTIECPPVGSFSYLETFANTDNVDRVPIRKSGKRNYDIIEHAVLGARIQVHELVSDSLDYPIICEFGPRCIVKLAHMWHVLAHHHDHLLPCYLGEGPRNCFYALGENDKLMCYNVHFDGEHWGVGRRPIDCNVEHKVGSLFFTY